MESRVFMCGLLSGFSHEEPDWAEVKARIGFLRDVYDLHIKLLEGYPDEEGSWNVPFFAVQTESGSWSDPKHLLSERTPYKVEKVTVMNPKNMDSETMSIMSALVVGGSASWALGDVLPKRGSQLPIKSAEDIFSGLIGMEKQKKQLMKIGKSIAACGKQDDDSMHMVFSGAPGTGKTELASRLVRYTDLLGVTDGSAKFVKVGEADLVAKYVGHTAPMVKSVVESALGGLLFIDEAYSLMNAPHFGQEAIDVLVDLLECHRGDFVCVIAGYLDEIQALLDSNPGLADRFGYRITFDSYESDELESIFLKIAEARGFNVELETCTLRSAMDQLKESHGFSNARSVRRLVKQSIDEAIWHHEDELTIRKNDLEKALAACIVPEKHKVGF